MSHHGATAPALSDLERAAPQVSSSALSSSALSSSALSSSAPATPSTRAPTTIPVVPGGAGHRRILAVVFPHLLCELAQRLHPSPRTCAPLAKADQSSPRSSTPKKRLESPRAIVLVDTLTSELDGRTELDAVNSAAYQLGVRPRQMLAHARASVESLAVQPLLRVEVQAALAHLAEMLLRFGSPVAFRAPDTIWVEITGSSHLHSSEQELALEVLAQLKAMGHAARVAVAPGPWLARAFAQHLPPGPMGILQVTPEQSARHVGELPIMALPIQQEAITWFARLGLLSIADLKSLPPSSLAGRLEGLVTAGSVSDVLELLHGHDNGILVPHHPEEAPREELFWEDPLEASEPLLFVLKGLAGRLSARLEGRGQATRELLLTLHYDRSIAALATGDGPSAPRFKSLSFKLATPLFHADDLERVMRLRLQRQKLLAPTVGLSLQASAITEAHHSQMSLSETALWRCGISTDSRAMTVLLAELSSDIGAESVGRLVTLDSHLPEKSCWLQPLSTDALNTAELTNTVEPVGVARAKIEMNADGLMQSVHALEGSLPFQHQHVPQAHQHIPQEEAGELYLPRLPTRVFPTAVEIHAPIRKNELWIIEERAYVVEGIHFEQRLESVEWWESSRVFRDYFRVWLVQASARIPNPQWARGASRQKQSHDVGGLEALVYRDRERGKSYLQALFD